MMEKLPKRANCGKCKSVYWYDGYTWCPGCDVNSVAEGERDGRYIEGAAENIRQMRASSQAILAAMAGEEA
jgi:uncharacterized Zn finger protein (UPF0148 family)